MPRKKNFNQDKYYKPFPTRLRMLMEETNETQADLADAIVKEDGRHPQRQTIGYYASGYRAPDYEMVKLIAEHYGVTTDWLVGMPGAVRTIKTDMQGVCKYLHISEYAAQMIKRVAENDEENEAVKDAILKLKRCGMAEMVREMIFGGVD